MGSKLSNVPTIVKALTYWTVVALTTHSQSVVKAACTSS